MVYWAQELRRRWRYFLPRLIWYVGIAAFVVAFVYMALPTGR
jgi:uncharacterized membrane protein